MQSFMDTTDSKISLLTFVLQEHHCRIVEDWLEFFDTPVHTLIVHVGDDPRILSQLIVLCKTYGVQLCNLGVTTAQETTENESKLLADQMASVDGGYGCVVRLDTLPFKQPGAAWQEEAFSLLRRNGAHFVTGSTLPYRADQPTDNNGYSLTQRVSNCFLIIEPAIWQELQKGTPETASRYGRFTVEGAVEDYLVAHDFWGVRLLNTPKIRIFHCQEWGLRLLDVRQSFRDGKRISPFLDGWQDNYFGAKARYYMKAGPTLTRRVRIAVGRWRRRFFGQL